ncbi:PREDICTED: polymerase delta-interacting protein 3-like [Ceratosolen solmsi marchali]|uniref:Polymerase delta-interacting protein 3-like n=1 Tax=Ceratosolen solmsi marchali TaxID=326594 RepID=A0AAJ6YBY0_9HYME|nr:PREDICTED: polymerase delta-interacting protein 3-like [Ceratosolen solmsi marchali]
MSHDLISLDDIIKKTKTSSSAMRSRGSRKSTSKNIPKTNGAPSIRGRGLERIEDARLKIIQKKRNHITDARDKLAQIAKQSDARLKLQKLRASNSKKLDPTSISRKPGRSGRISLTTNKLPSSHIPHSLPPAFIPPPSRSLSYRPPPIPESHYVNDMIMNYDVKFPKSKDFEYLQYHTKDYLMDRQAALRRTVSNDYAPTLPPPPPLFNIKPVSYDWDKPTHSESLSRSQSIRSSDHRPRDYKVIPRSGMTKIESLPVYRDEWSFGSKSRTIIPESVIESKYYSMRNHRELGVKSRLDALPAKSTRTVPSSSRPKSSSQSTGYRIIVSNLQANVTQEDIKELFEDVGELLVSRLVRPGVAEVIYKTLKDATKAVETYHNRQLDGHPMKCLLVNSRPKTSSTSSGRVLSQPRSSSSYAQPSLGTVHRALFDD